MRYRLIHLIMSLTFVASSSGESLDQPASSEATTGTEVDGYITMDLPVGGIVVTSMTSGKERIVRKPAKSRRATVHSVSGPDSAGTIAFVENHMLEGFHEIKTIQIDGSQERSLVRRDGDALWGDAIGHYLALSPVGRLLASVVTLRKVRLRSPRAVLDQGRLYILNLVTGEQLPYRFPAVDEPLHWSRDGAFLSYVGFVDQRRARELLEYYSIDSEDYARDSLQWPGVPTIHLLDSRTGSTSPVLPSRKAALSPEGRFLFVTDFQEHHRIVDLQHKSSYSVDITDTRVIGFLSETAVLALCPLSLGAERRFTERNSPLVRPKPTQSLRVLELPRLRTRTLKEYVDPRRTISVGYHVDRVRK